MGSDRASTLVLPSRAPRRVGTLHRVGDRFSFEPAPNQTICVNDKPCPPSYTLQVAPWPKPSDRVRFGDFAFAIRPVGDRYELLLRDAQSPFVKNFVGCRWYPIGLEYKIPAKLEPVKDPRPVAIEMTDGGSRQFKGSGDLVFLYGGQTLRLKALFSPDEKNLFVMFRDETSGRETYGAGRFLEVEPPSNGTTMLDFNKADNPYCAYDSYAVCPVTPRHNRLPLPIRAGETYPPKLHSHSSGSGFSQ